MTSVRDSMDLVRRRNPKLWTEKAKKERAAVWTPYTIDDVIDENWAERTKKLERAKAKIDFDKIVDQVRKRMDELKERNPRVWAINDIKERDEEYYDVV